MECLYVCLHSFLVRPSKTQGSEENQKTHGMVWGRPFYRESDQCSKCLYHSLRGILTLSISHSRIMTFVFFFFLFILSCWGDRASRYFHPFLTIFSPRQSYRHSFYCLCPPTIPTVKILFDLRKTVYSLFFSFHHRRCRSSSVRHKNLKCLPRLWMKIFQDKSTDFAFIKEQKQNKNTEREEVKKKYI